MDGASTVAEFLGAYGAEGVLILILILFLRGDIITRSAAENLIKLTIHELTGVMRGAVADGIRDAFDISKEVSDKE